MGLIEVYSGHGNSENYRDFRVRKFIQNDEGGDYNEGHSETRCEAPTNDELSRCWRAGQLVYEACLSDGVDVAECGLKSEHARDEFAAKGQSYCPEPQPNYLPSCWQAGEIIKQRCEEAGETAKQCSLRVEEARRLYANVDHAAAWLIVPDTRAEDWLDAGQARDMFFARLQLPSR